MDYLVRPAASSRPAARWSAARSSLTGNDRNLGGAFMYESKGAQDLRPRLGEEPSRVLIGDLNGEWRMHPQFLTRWMDAPARRAHHAPSEFNLAAEVGASFPNPNTFNEVFIDDMEACATRSRSR